MSITVRSTIQEDTAFLAECFEEPGVLSGFPMESALEIQDSVHFWVHNALQGTGLTALYDGKPAGMIVFYVQPFSKFQHTCLFSLMVHKDYRKKGIAIFLMKEIEKLAKEKYHIEILHLEVYDVNLAARKLYEKLGYITYGVQKKFIKEGSVYVDKILMQKKL